MQLVDDTEESDIGEIHEKIEKHLQAVQDRLEKQIQEHSDRHQIAVRAQAMRMKAIEEKMMEQSKKSNQRLATIIDTVDTCVLTCGQHEARLAGIGNTMKEQNSRLVSIEEKLDALLNRPWITFLFFILGSLGRHELRYECY